MKPWVVLGVALAWVLLGVVFGSQTALRATMSGTPVPIGETILGSVVGFLPWIPATLVAIAIGARFPLTLKGWKRSLPVHVVALPFVSWVANVGIVLSFGMIPATFDGLVLLSRQAAFWGTMNLHWAALVYVLTVTLAQGWAFVRDTRARELRFARLETQLAQARFQTLNAQIRPHFLFNTLHTIGQLWRSGRSDDAEQMLDHLGSLFQRVRASTDRPSVTLDEELSMVEEYLAIEQTRFVDRLRTVVRASPEARRCMIPPLLLQPLVENAIRHGISHSADAGCVSVDAQVTNGTLVVEICDDGPGIDSESPSPGSGTGLSNTRERLQHAYPDAHVFAITTPDGGGACVRVELPAAHDPDDSFGGEP